MFDYQKECNEFFKTINDIHYYLKYTIEKKNDGRITTLTAVGKPLFIEDPQVQT